MNLKGGHDTRLEEAAKQHIKSSYIILARFVLATKLQVRCKSTRGCSPVIAVAHGNVRILDRFFDGVSEQSHFVALLSGSAIDMQKRVKKVKRLKQPQTKQKCV